MIKGFFLGLMLTQLYICNIYNKLKYQTTRMVMILSNTKSKTEPYVCQKKCDIQGVPEIAKQLKA